MARFGDFRAQFFARGNLNVALADGAGGRLVVSLDHPFRDCFSDDAEDEMSITPVRSYFSNEPMRWQWRSTGIRRSS